MSQQSGREVNPDDPGVPDDSVGPDTPDDATGTTIPEPPVGGATPHDGDSDT